MLGMTLTSRWHGKTQFVESMKLMEETAQQALSLGRATLLGFEYPRTITLGRRAHGDTAGLDGSIPFIQVSRGGLATLHNEGQCVIYPIVPIKQYGIFAKEWVQLLTSVTKLSLEKCNIIVESTSNGVFTPIGKIASIGIDIKKGVSTHGIAINVSNLLSDFAHIIPCGIADQVFDRVGNYESKTPEEFFDLWCSDFENCFAPYKRRSLDEHAHNTLVSSL